MKAKIHRLEIDLQLGCVLFLLGDLLLLLIPKASFLLLKPLLSKPGLLLPLFVLFLLFNMFFLELLHGLWNWLLLYFDEFLPILINVHQ